MRDFWVRMAGPVVNGHNDLCTYFNDCHWILTVNVKNTPSLMNITMTDDEKH